MTARRLSAPEIDAILSDRRASAVAAMKGRAHRALALDEVERRRREQRTAWPMTCGSCNTGYPGNCDCMPAAGASAVSGIEDEDPYNLRPHRAPKPRRPNYTWAAVVFFAVLCAIQWVRT